MAKRQQQAHSDPSRNRGGQGQRSDDEPLDEEVRDEELRADGDPDDDYDDEDDELDVDIELVDEEE